MHKLTTKQAENILLYDEKDKEWVKNKIIEYDSLGFTFYKSTLSYTNFCELIYNSKNIPHCQLKEAADIYLKNNFRNPQVEEIKKSILNKGYDLNSYLFLRELYLKEDLPGSYYIDNGLHRSLALSIILIQREISHPPIPVIITFKSSPQQNKSFN